MNVVDEGRRWVVWHWWTSEVRLRRRRTSILRACSLSPRCSLRVLHSSNLTFPLSLVGCLSRQKVGDTSGVVFL